jgi:arsenite methyltransferase
VDCDLYKQTPFRNAAGEGFRPGGLELTDELAAACGLWPGDRVLDLACGAGLTALHLTQRYGVRVTGIDASPGFLGEARERAADVEWVLGSAADLPFEAATFDAVFAECFLSTFADPAPVLREIRRVLRPGGRLAVSDMYLREPGAAPPGAGAPAATCLSGARGKKETLAAHQASGLRPTLWEDRSDTLKVLMAALIMEYGSAAAFWEAAVGGAAREVAPAPAPAPEAAHGAGAGATPGAALAAARPGYFLMIAYAPEDPDA